MPIRFRCAYCKQLMGIARRKAGSVVRCPTCGGQVVVPTPPPEEAQQPLPMAEVFERTDFDAILQPDPSSGVLRRQGKTSPTPSEEAGSSPQVEALESGSYDDFVPISRGMSLTPGKMILFIMISLLLMLLSFFAGLLVGRSSVLVNPPPASGQVE